MELGARLKDHLARYPHTHHRAQRGDTRVSSCLYEIHFLASAIETTRIVAD
jgi:hypothetical protein